MGLLSFASILVATSSKYILENLKRMKKVSLKKEVGETIFDKQFFLLKIIPNVCRQKCHRNLNKKNYVKRASLFYSPRFVRCFAPNTPHRELRPQAPDFFVLNPPSQLVIGCHRLAFLKPVRKELKTQSSKSTIH